MKAGLVSDKPADTVAQPHEVDRRATVQEVIKLVKQHFPTATENQSDFLKVNKNFIDNLCRVEDVNSELLKHSIKQCPLCLNSALEKWHHKTKVSYLISLAEVKRIRVEPRFCKSCKLILYYDLYSFGCFPIHNKVIVKTPTQHKTHLN